MTQRVELRGVREEDFDVLFQNQRDAEAAAIVGYAPRERDDFDASSARHVDHFAWAASHAG